MKIKKPKRIMSLFLAALMCVTTFAGFGTTAYAAEETDEVYLVSFPRDGDDNYSGEWGHGSHEFMNGWATDTSRYTSVYAFVHFHAERGLAAAQLCGILFGFRQGTFSNAQGQSQYQAGGSLP